MSNLNNVTFVWPSGTQEELRANQYPKDHPQRIPTEKYFAGEVKKIILDVRDGVEYVNLWLLIASLENLENPELPYGFDSWFWAIEAVLGADTCRRIGKDVCEEMNFTLHEAKNIYNGPFRENSALGWKLKPSATWDEIHEAARKAAIETRQKRREARQI